MAAAELLGVAYRTLVKAEESGEDHGTHERCPGAAPRGRRTTPKRHACASAWRIWRTA